MTGPVLFLGDWVLGQAWLFRVAPPIGRPLGGTVCRWLSPQPDEPWGGRVRRFG